MILEEISRRRSIRAYLPKPVEKEKMNRILEAAKLAPTAKNLQDWKLLVIDEKNIREELVDASSPHQTFLYTAPVLLAACAVNPNYVMRCGQPAYPIDLAIVLDHITLQAVREGLGTCWIGSFDEAEAKRVLGIPNEVRIVQLMSLGYYENAPQARPRKDTGQLFKWNHW